MVRGMENLEKFWEQTGEKMLKYILMIFLGSLIFHLSVQECRFPLGFLIGQIFYLRQHRTIHLPRSQPLNPLPNRHKCPLNLHQRRTESSRQTGRSTSKNQVRKCEHHI